MEERNKGNYAYIKCDKIVVKENTNINDKIKREISSTSPQTDSQPKKQQVNQPKNKKMNPFETMRGRSFSYSGNPATKEQ